MNLLILVVVSTIFISAMCSLFEATLYSTRITALEAARAGGKHRRLAGRFLKMKRDIAVPTSAILILNTLANTAGATLAGMFAAQVLGVSLVPVFSIGLTLAILFLAEIFPKTYGVIYWQTLWPLIVWPLTAIQMILYPGVRVTQKILSLFTRKRSVPIITEEEILATIRLGFKAGELTPSELHLINAVLHFDELVCSQIMVPRREVVFFDSKWSIPKCIELAKQTKHTRYPICRGSLDDSIGLIHIKDLVGVSSDRSLDLKSIMRPLRQVSETMPINRLLREIQKTHQHMAIVVNEFGTTVGIVTLENVLEQIVGSVQDEFDTETPEIVREGPRKYTAQGHLPLSRINRELDLNLSSPGVDTLSGLLVSKMGRFLKIGDTIPLDGAVAVVREVQAHRATRICLELDREIDSEIGLQGEKVD